MDCSQVLCRLSEIERAIGVLDYISLRKMVIETQDYILGSQKETARPLPSSWPRMAASR